MYYGMYVSAAGALANSYRQDVVSNNLANVDTAGFKRDLALLTARRTQARSEGTNEHTEPVLEGQGGGLFGLPTYTDFSAGGLEKTGSPFDLGIEGAGFFQVRDARADGQIYYTRDGRLTHDSENRLVTATGKMPLLDKDGQTIVINPHVKIDVDETGRIYQGDQEVARIGVVDFADHRQLNKRGQNLYSVQAGADSQVIQPRLRQGVVELSGVDPIRELTEMIQAQRLFQANVQMLRVQDQTLGLAVSQLGRIA